MEIGIRIRKLRRERDLTQAELAARLGINKQNVSRYESGRVEPRRNMLDKFATALGVSLDELLGSSEPEEDLPDDPEFRRLFKEVISLPEDDQKALKHIIKAVVQKHRATSALAS